HQTWVSPHSYNPYARLRLIFNAMSLRLALQGPPLAMHLIFGVKDQCLGRNLLAHRGARGDVRPAPDSQRRDELAIAADEDFVLDNDLVFLRAVVVTGDEPRPHVDVPTHHDIADIAEVGGLGVVANDGLFDL